MRININLDISEKPIQAVLAAIFNVIMESINEGTCIRDVGKKVKMLSMSERFYQATMPLSEKTDDDLSTDIERLSRLSDKSIKLQLFKEFIDCALEFTNQKYFILIFDPIEAEYILKDFYSQYELQKFLLQIPEKNLKLEGLENINWVKNILKERI